MTELLERVINQIKDLPSQEQDAYRKVDHYILIL